MSLAISKGMWGHNMIVLEDPNKHSTLEHISRIEIASE